MAVEHMGWAMRQDPSIFGGSAASKMVLVALAWRADADGLCGPTYEDLAETAGCSVTCIRAQVKILHQAGLIAIERGGGSGRPNRYWLLLS